MFKRLKTNNKGFTLIELIIVMMVIGILVLLAVPRFGDFRDKAKVSQIQNDVKLIENLIAVDIADNINNNRMPKDYGNIKATENVDASHVLIDKTGERLVKLKAGEEKKQIDTTDGKKLIDDSGTQLKKDKFYIIYNGSDFRVVYRAAGEINIDSVPVQEVDE